MEVQREILSAPPGESLEEALAHLRAWPDAAIPVRDPETGLVVALLSRPDRPPQAAPPRLGGMATPLGVYLTDGVVCGGAGFWGLFLTGVTLFLLALLAQEAVRGFGALAANQSLYHGLGIGQGQERALRAWLAQSGSWLALPLIFVLLRLIPMSGTHAAEHQAVHCVEKRRPLTLDEVRAQPRVHPRCGTNIFVGFSLFLVVFVGVFTTQIANNLDVTDAASTAAICAVIPTLLLWRRIGGFVQKWFATRPATDMQIAGAIKAAEETLARRQRVSGGALRFRSPLRIWRIGLAQVMLGYFAVFTPLALAINYWPQFGKWLGL